MGTGSWIKAIAHVGTNIALQQTTNHLGNKVTNMALRKNQIFDKNIEIKEQDWRPARFCVQRHNAKRAGLHRDIRIEYKGRAISIVTKKNLPKPGKIQRMIRTADHVLDYMDFEGTIPKGEFGAGTVKIEQNSTALVKVDSLPSIGHKFKLIVPDGKYKGNYAIVHLGHDAYQVSNLPRPRQVWFERNKYSSIILTKQQHKEMLKDPNFIGEEKIDGAHAIAHIGEKSSAIVSRGKDVNENLISYDYKLPHISVLHSKKYAGTIVRYEVFHKFGSSFLSGLLNSNFDKAVDTQNKCGKAVAYIIDIKSAKINGKPVKFNSYEDKTKFMIELAENMDSKYIKIPERIKVDKQGFFEKIKARAGEGIVIKNKNHANYESPWYKYKVKQTFDLKVIDIVPGRGKYKDKAAGAFIAVDNSGICKVTVGTGLSDEMRIDMKNNPKKYIGKIIEVEAMSNTAKSLRAPAFKRIRTDKTVPDTINIPGDNDLILRLQGEGLSGKELLQKKYKFIKRRIRC